MNRIYQGRVSKVFDDQKQELDLNVLWQHHELFQDAVNYYVVCLLALAQPGNALWPIREKLNAKTEAGDDDELMVWRPFRRRGATRPGLRDSVAKYFTPENPTPTPEDCFTATLAGNECAQTEEGRARLDAGLTQLLKKCTGEAGCKQAAPVFLPRFAKPAYQGSYGEDTTTLARASEAARLPFVVHDSKTRADSPALNEFDVHSIALTNEKKPKFVGKEAIQKLHSMVAEWRKRQPANEADWQRMEAIVGKLADNFEMPGYAATSAKNDVKFRLFAMFFFRYVERSEFTLGLLRATTRKPDADEVPPEAKAIASGTGDPIRIARGARGYVFRAFTSLPCWGGDAKGTPSWIEFDFAAFEEALKALHQVEAKGEERKKEREKKQAQHDYQRGKTKRWKAASSGEEGARPAVLAGDKRLEQLAKLVDEDLREEYEMSEGVSVKYGLHQRTIRGFRDLRKKWNETAKDAPYSEELKTKLVEDLRGFQKENPNIVGSVRLFEALLEKENWLIWREPSAEEQRDWRKAAKLADDVEFAKDPLQALTDERELLNDIERLGSPIRFTPADPVYSRRQFYFSDVSPLDKKNRLRHDQQTLETEIAINTGTVAQPKWERQWVRVAFTAPRLLRDQLNNTTGADAAWQQAMMAALGIKTGLLKNGKPAKFSDCAAVALMPEADENRRKNMLLNFPITLDGESIASQLGIAAKWNTLQFGGADGESYWLRWKTTWIDEKKERKKAPPAPWWTGRETFRVLPVDLGQRDAGAFALLEVTPGTAPKKQSRKVGNADSTDWWATVRATGMLRLPGEDAMVMREGEWQEELSGNRGRMATDKEWGEARDICTKLGLVPDKILGTEHDGYSFPEMNDRLLYTLRRAQSRLARLQSWSSVTHKDTKPKRKENIAKQITEAIAARAEEEVKPEKEREQEMLERNRWLVEANSDVEAGRWECVRDRIIREIAKERQAIQCELLRIADRVQPLRGRRWEWVLRANDSKNHVLSQTIHGSDTWKKLLAGQRGLSLKRIEQLESLRQRCQSLNRALQQIPGEPAKLGKSKRGIELPDPCPELLERLDALKEQRVNQTAHLILAQALGVRLKAHTTNEKERSACDIHGEYERIPGRQPVDFVILENLDRYLASQGRARSENSRLMKWCHRAILGKLKQLCEPYGIRVLETPAAYSSKFCSLTGCAGFRAVELTPGDAKDFRWQKHFNRLAEADAGKRKLSADERSESEAVKQVFAQLAEMNADLLKARPARPKWRTLLAPMQLGPIFVPMHGNPMQADINAAINLGLRAIAAPNMDDIHLRLRAERKDDTFVVRVENAREKARWKDGAPEIHVTSEADRKKLLTDARLNFFFDFGHVANYDHATIDGIAHPVASGRGIWGSVNQNDWKLCKEINNTRIHKPQ